jgi:hypothetical protein
VRVVILTEEVQRIGNRLSFANGIIYFGKSVSEILRQQCVVSGNSRKGPLWQAEVVIPDYSVEIADLIKYEPHQMTITKQFCHCFVPHLLPLTYFLTTD